MSFWGIRLCKIPEFYLYKCIFLCENNFYYSYSIIITSRRISRKKEKICKSLIYINCFLAKSSLSYKMYHRRGLEVKLRMSVEELSNKKHQKKKNTDRYFLESTVIQKFKRFLDENYYIQPCKYLKKQIFITVS